MNPPQTLYRACSDVRFRVLAGEAVVVQQKAREVVVLNEVGARILQLLEPAASADSLVESLELEFDVDSTTLRADVEEFLRELLQIGVIDAISGEATQ